MTCSVHVLVCCVHPFVDIDSMAEEIAEVEIEESAEKMACVRIGSEEFSIVEVPSSATTIVRKQREHLLGSIDLPVLVEDLGRVGNFVRLAYNGTAGHTELQIKIREIGYDVTKLCDKSAVTVSKFKQASGSILDDLQGTYQFLLDGLEDIALETLASVSEVAKGMVTAAEELHKDFSDESKKVEEVLKDTMKEKGEDEKRKKDIEKKERKYEADRIRAEKDQQASEQEYAECEKRYREAEEKQEKAYASAANPFKAMVNAFVSPLGFRAFDTEGDKEKASEHREEKLKHLDDMKKQRERRREALQDIAEFAKHIIDCRKDADLAEAAIDALHKAMGGLQKLSAIMLQVALFWKQMQMHCETLARDKMQKMVLRAMKQPEKKRLRVWTATGFKKQAITYYAQWVALDDVCAVYMAKIKETQKTLYGYLTENPTLSEARANVRQLAIEFSDDLKKAHSEIDEKNAADEEERARMLEAGCSGN